MLEHWTSCEDTPAYFHLMFTLFGGKCCWHASKTISSDDLFEINLESIDSWSNNLSYEPWGYC